MNKTSLLVALMLMIDLVASSSYYHICFDGPIDDRQRGLVEGDGYEIVGYEPDFCYIARGSGSATAGDGYSIEKTGSARSKGLKVASSAIGADISKDITVLLFPGEDPQAMLGEIDGISPATASDGQVLTIVSATPDQLEQISSIPGIMKVGKRGELSVFNDYAAPVLGASDVWTRLGMDGGLTIVAVADTGLDTGNISAIHADFMGRIVAISAWCDGLKLPQYCSGNAMGRDFHGHGTHVTGSVLGNGSMSAGQIKGMAPGARLFMQSLNPGGKSSIYAPDDLRLLFVEAKEAGASIHSNSWGDSQSIYSIDSYLIDDFAYNNPESLLIFAAGNKGPYSKTISSQASAKNALSIGSLQSSRYGGDTSSVSGFSSRGPASDGRIKPDLVAPGEMILSAKSSIVGANPCGYGSYDGYYSFCTGTSMAAPLSAGSAALVRDYLIGRGYGSPGSADIKALLIAGADRIPDDGSSPNGNAGFGRINLSRTLASDGRAMNLSHGSASTGSDDIMNFSIAKGADRVSFALVWVDPPCASLDCDTDALVNDIDLKVVLPDGTGFYGNSHIADSSDPDRKNNAELVSIQDPESGNYQVEITGYNVPLGPQDFVLAVLGDIDSDRPVVDILSPEDIPFEGESIPLEFVASDETGIDSCWYVLDGSQPADLPGCQNTTLTGLARGDHTVVVYANDTAGKTGWERRQFFSYPAGSMSILLTKVNETIWTRSAYYLRFPFSVGFSGIPSVSCALEDGSGKSISSLSISKNGSYSFSPSLGSAYKPNNAYQMRIICAYAIYPFLNGTKGITLIYDTAPPRINASFSGIWVNRSAVNVTYSVTDNLADAMACVLTAGTSKKTATVLNGSSQGESIIVPYQGRNAVSISCKDRISNSATVSGTVYLDSVAPRPSIGHVTQATRANADGTKNVTISYTITETNALSATYYTIDGLINGSLGPSKSGSYKAGLALGNHTIRIESKDSVMNTGSVEKNFTVR